VVGEGTVKGRACRAIFIVLLYCWAVSALGGESGYVESTERLGDDFVGPVSFFFFPI
jgi:hypothetical protein